MFETHDRFSVSNCFYLLIEEEHQEIFTVGQDSGTNSCKRLRFKTTFLIIYSIDGIVYFLGTWVFLSQNETEMRGTLMQLCFQYFSHFCLQVTVDFMLGQQITRLITVCQ